MLPTHVRDCESSGCEGCQPCERRHCTMPRCSRHLSDHETLVCAKCVGAVRQNLRRIVALCTIAPVAMLEAGVDSGVAVLVGPVPEHSTWTARHNWIESGAPCKCESRGVVCPDTVAIEGPTCHSATCGHTTCGRIHGVRVCPDVLAWLDTADDERHPLWVLGSWDMLIAEHYGDRRTLRVTVPSASAYLEANLTDLARDTDFAFDELAREIADCLLHVEQVLCVAWHIQRGAPCPACRDAGRKAKSLERQYAEDEPTDAEDRWVCPTAACGKVYEPDQYAKVMYVDYLRHADKLTAQQMAVQYRVPEGTLRRWANGWTDRLGNWNPPTVRKRGYDGFRHQLYEVADVKAMRDVDAAVA